MPDLPNISRYLTEQTEVAQRQLILPTSFVAAINAIASTFSVKNITRVQLISTAPQNVTYFDNGQEGQELVILGDGQVTVKYDVTKIITNTGADKLLVADKLYKFHMFKRGNFNVWYEL